MLVPAKSENKKFVPLWRAGRKLVALAFLFVILLSASAVYSYSEKTAPTPVVKLEGDILYPDTSVATKAITLRRIHFNTAFAPGIKALQAWGQRIHILATNETSSVSVGGKVNDFSASGTSDADYFIVESQIAIWQNDTVYYSSGFLDNTDGKIVIYSDHMYGTPIVYINNTVYWNGSRINENYSNEFWWIPLPQGKLANISFKCLNTKSPVTVTAVKTIWYTLDYRFATSDSDLNSIEPETNNNENIETLVIGTDNFDEYIKNVLAEWLKQNGYSDVLEGDWDYNITKPNVGFAELKYSTIEASIFGIIHIPLFSEVRIVSFGWSFPDLGSAFKNAVKRLHFVVSSSVNTVVKRVSSGVNSIKKSVSSFSNFVTTNVRKAVKTAYQQGKGFITTVTSGVSNTIKAVGNFFNGIGSTVSKAVQNFGNAIKNGATTVWNAVTGAFGKVYHGVASFFGGIVSWFKKFWWAILLVVILFVVLIGVFIIGPAVQARRRF